MQTKMEGCSKLSEGRTRTVGVSTTGVKQARSTCSYQCVSFQMLLLAHFDLSCVHTGNNFQQRDDERQSVTSSYYGQQKRKKKMAMQTSLSFEASD